MQSADRTDPEARGAAGGLPQPPDQGSPSLQVSGSNRCLLLCVQSADRADPEARGAAGGLPQPPDQGSHLRHGRRECRVVSAQHPRSSIFSAKMLLIGFFAS